MRPRLLILALLLTAGAAPRGELAGVRLDCPRGGEGADAVLRIARCLDESDHDCLEEALQAGELLPRAAVEAREKAHPVERPGFADYWRRGIEAGGPRRTSLVRTALVACAGAFNAALGGRCDDTGPMVLPAQRALPPEFLALRNELTEGLRRRRARRLVCGPVDVAGKLRVEEVVVVLAERAGRTTTLDLRCRNLIEDLEPGEAEAEEAPLPSPTAEAVAALELAAHALECLGEESELCLERVAPLSMLQARALVDALGGPAEEREVALAEGMLAASAHASRRAQYVMALVNRTCRSEHLTGDACDAPREVRPPKEPELPPGLTPGEQARARAILGFIWRGHRDTPRKAREVVCGPHRSVIVYTDPGPGEVPGVLDLICPE